MNENARRREQTHLIERLVKVRDHHTLCLVYGVHALNLWKVETALTGFGRPMRHSEFVLVSSGVVLTINSYAPVNIGPNNACPLCRSLRAI